MKTIPALVLAAVLGVALLAGVGSYQLASSSTGADSPAASPAPAATQARPHQARPRVRWAPCTPPAVRRGKVCVTEEVRTVVVPAPVAPAAPAAPVAQAVRGDDEHAEDGGDRHESEHEYD